MQCCVCFDMAKLPPKYCFVGKEPTKDHVVKTNFTIRVKNNTASDLINPLFNFNKKFTEDFSKITQAELAQAIPYIKIDIVNLTGEVVTNLNASFFQKQIDFNNAGKEARYGDRPTMSLQSIDISTDEASGYLYYTHVTLRLKIHKKDSLSDKAILALLFPGCPLRLEYGWNSSNELLNQKQVLSINVKNYNLSIDSTGQVDLTVECLAFNDMFSNIYIGDLGAKSKSNTKLSKNFQQITQFLEGLEKAKASIDKNSNDYTYVTSQITDLRKAEKEIRGSIEKKFADGIHKLHSMKPFEVKFGKNKKPIKCLTFHDIVHTLCNDTLTALTENLPFEIVYGSFNDHCLEFKSKSIADFPVDQTKLLDSLAEFGGNGEPVLTLKVFLELLMREYCQNEDYIVAISNVKPQEEEKDKAGKVIKAEEDFNIPTMVMNFTNTGKKLLLSIFDAKSNLPVTTNKIKNIAKSSQSKIEDIFKDFNLATLSLGNANTFIKDINLSQESDAYMKAVFIVRAHQASSLTVGDPTLPSDVGVNEPTNAMTLPLRGSATVIGHPAWLPMRAFYLSTGLFMVDAVYIIHKVSHTLSRDGFETKIDFRWN